jgi:hypothetical protein
MTEDLTTWLRTQLDEDERIAIATAVAHHPAATWHLNGAGDIEDHQGGYVACGPYGCGMDEDDSAHIIRWQPARVLAEIQAKRRILDLHPHLPVVQPIWPGLPSHEDDGPHRIGCQTCKFSDTTTWWCDTVRLLALPHAGRPGYRDEWRPA